MKCSTHLLTMSFCCLWIILLQNTCDVLAYSHFSAYGNGGSNNDWFKCFFVNPLALLIYASVKKVLNGYYSNISSMFPSSVLEDLIFRVCLRQSTLYHQSHILFFWLNIVPFGHRKLWRGDKLPPGHMCQTYSCQKKERKIKF